MNTDSIAQILEPLRQKSEQFSKRIRPLFDAAPASAPCLEHPTQSLARDWEETFSRSASSGHFRLAYEECPLCVQRQFWHRRRVPDRLLDATLENFQQTDANSIAAVENVRTFVEQIHSGGFLLLLGGPGLGKTHLAVGVVKNVGDGSFITHADLLTKLRASYDSGNTEDFLDLYQRTRCLILDDLGVSAGGRDEQPMLHQILAARYDRRLPTVITSNEELPTLKQLFGYRLVDRMRENCHVVSLRGESFRKPKDELP